MNSAIIFTRVFFGLVSLFFMIAYMVAYPEGNLFLRVFSGISLGGAFALLLVGLDTLLRKFSLRFLNIATVGLFCGFLLGKALVLLLGAILETTMLNIFLSVALVDLMKISLYLFSTYFATILAFRFADEVYFSIPFIRLSQSTIKKKDILLDYSVLSDSRIIDFCNLGLLNNHVVIPKFLIKELQAQVETGEEGIKLKAKKALDTIKKLESLSCLCLRYQEMDFPEIKELNQKIIKLARFIDAHILTAEPNRINTPSDDLLFINIHSLSHALKPTTPPGETISIKVQRYGKEPKQGVGYLEDGTMVVINNGGAYIGEVIDTQVISVKHTSAGRIIFTNALVDDVHMASMSYEGGGSYDSQHE